MLAHLATPTVNLEIYGNCQNSGNVCILGAFLLGTPVFAISNLLPPPPQDLLRHRLQDNITVSISNHYQETPFCNLGMDRSQLLNARGARAIFCAGTGSYSNFLHSFPRTVSISQSYEHMKPEVRSISSPQGSCLQHIWLIFFLGNSDLNSFPQITFSSSVCFCAVNNACCPPLHVRWICIKIFSASVQCRSLFPDFFPLFSSWTTVQRHYIGNILCLTTTTTTTLSWSTCIFPPKETSQPNPNLRWI